VLPDIVDGAPYSLSVVFELAKGAVAHLAEDPPDAAGRVIMVDVNRSTLLADGTHPALRRDHRVDFGRTDSESLLQVVVPRVPVETPNRGSGSRVMTRLAVLAAAVLLRPVPREIFFRLRDATV